MIERVCRRIVENQQELHLSIRYSQYIVLFEDIFINHLSGPNVNGLEMFPFI